MVILTHAFDSKAKRACFCKVIVLCLNMNFAPQFLHERTHPSYLW
jgi:hypothetical protein